MPKRGVENGRVDQTMSLEFMGLIRQTPPTTPALS
jgi:hypothetical protein